MKKMHSAQFYLVDNLRRKLRCFALCAISLNGIPKIIALKTVIKRPFFFEKNKLICVVVGHPVS